MLIDCVTVDPRWHGLDHRSDCYARLATHRAIDSAPFEAAALAEEAEVHETDPGISLAIQVIARMAVLGDERALSAARRYVAVGEYWDQVVHILVFGDPLADVPADGWQDRTEGLAQVICARWSKQGELREALDHVGDVAELPWPLWADEQPRIRAVVDDRQKRRGAVSPIEFVAGMSIREIVALNDPRYVWAASQAFEKPLEPSDVEVLLRVARDPSAVMHAPAVAALAARGHVEVLPQALAFPSRNSYERRLLFRAFTALPHEATGALALEWLSGKDVLKRRAGAAALARHCIPADAPLIRGYLAAELVDPTNPEQNLIGSLVTALARHPEAGPFPEILEAYETVVHSQVRIEVVEALAVAEPTFSTGVAVDCLWDAEPSVRRIAVARVDGRVAAARDRLAAMREDPFEDPAVLNPARPRAAAELLEKTSAPPTPEEEWCPSGKAVAWASLVAVIALVVLVLLAPPDRPEPRQLALRALPVARFVPPRAVLAKQVGRNDQVPDKYSGPDVGHTQLTRYFRIDRGGEAASAGAVTAEVRRTGWLEVKPRTATTRGSAWQDVNGEPVTVGWWTVASTDPGRKELATPYLVVQLIYNESTTGGITYATP